MADKRQLELLKLNEYQWNEWRTESACANPDLSGADLRDADLGAADLKGAILSQANLSGADLTGVNLRDSLLVGANLRNANLTGTGLTGANLIHADLTGAILCNAHLYNAALREANLTRADLTGAYLGDTDLWKANLTMANLTRAGLPYSDLTEANLREANLTRAGLQDTDLTGASLHEANLAGAYLTGAKLIETDLSRADLTEADLARATLREVKLTGADLTRANLFETCFINVDLSQIKGLDSCYHHGPSVLDHRTLAKSGRLPLSFLRGCGLPDELIASIPSLQGSPIQYYACFISYSSKDDEFAKRLHHELQGRGVRCWFDREDLKIGNLQKNHIFRSNRLQDKLLLVLSEESVQSTWAEREVEQALARELKGDGPVLFPVRIDDRVMNTEKPWADNIQQARHIGDFRGWEDDLKFKPAFERLMRDLKQS